MPLLSTAGATALQCTSLSQPTMDAVSAAPYGRTGDAAGEISHAAAADDKVVTARRRRRAPGVFAGVLIGGARFLLQMNALCMQRGKR